MRGLQRKRSRADGPDEQRVAARITGGREGVNALHRRSVYILIGRRVRALESNSTGLPIGLDLPEQRGAAGTVVGVRM